MIQQEHVEEMKQDHFCKGLNGEQPTSYSNLFLADQKLERWAETGDPHFPKSTPTSG